MWLLIPKMAAWFADLEHHDYARDQSLFHFKIKFETKYYHAIQAKSSQIKFEFVLLLSSDFFF